MYWMSPSRKGIAAVAVAAGLALTVGAGTAAADEVGYPNAELEAAAIVSLDGDAPVTAETAPVSFVTGSVEGTIDAVPAGDGDAATDSADGDFSGESPTSDAANGSGDEAAPSDAADGSGDAGAEDPGSDKQGDADVPSSDSDDGAQGKETGSDKAGDSDSSSDSDPGDEGGLSDADDEHPDNGWWTNPATGELEYYVDGVLTTPDRVFYTDGNGDKYWYENGVMREEHAFYDPATDKWYWADLGGKCARNKDTYIPLNDAAEAGDWRNNGNGKWVRVADDFSLVKGENYSVSRDDSQWHWWYFDACTGQMLKNFVYVASYDKWCYYDDTFGWMVYGEQYRQTNDHLDWGYNWYYFDDYTGATIYGWKYLNNGSKWVWYDTTTGVMAHGQRIIDGYSRRFDNATGACDKIGYQNDPRYYQVSSWNVSVPGSGQWAYATSSRIGVDATREDCIEAMIARAYEYLGSPYVWDYSCAPGVGVDCAGLVMQCLYATGMDLYPYTPWDHYFTVGHDHYANDMWNDGRFMHVDFGSRQRGDLICYSGHIAIYLGNDTIIEAYTPATGVRISNVYSSSGIKGALRPFN